jgi:hypothetical protein
MAAFEHRAPPEFAGDVRRTELATGLRQYLCHVVGRRTLVGGVLGFDPLSDADWQFRGCENLVALAIVRLWDQISLPSVGEDFPDRFCQNVSSLVESMQFNILSSRMCFAADRPYATYRWGTSARGKAGVGTTARKLTF